ncbi:MAG: acyltransferase, partial [Burkholderiales bacterium]
MVQPRTAAAGYEATLYRRDIDGLRAIAVLAVLVFHAFPSALTGGFVGVDVFFVISGFLITKVILGALEKGRFSVLDFYVRRVRRIFPALAVVLLACFAFGWSALLAEDLAHLSKHIVGGATFLANIFFWSESGYFDKASEFKPLLHLWSLGIEEQFYLAWPLLLAAAWRRGVSVRWLMALTAA